MSLQNILFDLLILGIFGIAVYAFLIMPRRRQFRKRVEYVSQLEPGAEITTYGGIIGTVISIDSQQGTAMVEIADGLQVKVLAAAIMDEYKPEEVAESAQKALDE